MGIALFSATALMESLQGVMGWLAPREPLTTARAPAHTSVPMPLCVTATRQVARTVRHPRPTCSASPARALRVVRVIDTPLSTGAGRMVISGRMADVCAELDRLAALEAGYPSSMALN